MSEQEMGRLAMRVEGDWWNAYYALPNTMKDALHLGSIRMAFVAADWQRKELFMSMMKDAVSDIIKERIGVEATWPEARPAPEHERSGKA
jgi:hypothetical protein